MKAVLFISLLVVVGFLLLYACWCVAGLLHELNNNDNDYKDYDEEE